MIELEDLSHYNQSSTLISELDKRERIISRLWDTTEYEDYIRKCLTEKITISWMITQRQHYLKLTQHTLKHFGLCTA